MKDARAAYSALSGRDESFNSYIAYAQGAACAAAVPTSAPANLTLFDAVLKGIKGESASITKKLLETEEPMEIVNGYIIPALDEVGRLYEANKVYLPGLLLSAEAAKASFELISAKVGAAKSRVGKVVIATVEGDIHDIGKNIVKLILENYGFGVTDLGKDVPCELIAKTALDMDADVVALSALMTTTAPAMAKTIKLLRASGARARVIVGGAVITPDYAESIGADAYGKDAMATVRFVQSVIEK